jgi:hypothetical protein
VKHLVLVIFVLVLFSTVSAQRKVSDKDFEGLIGAVNSVIYGSVSAAEMDKSFWLEKPSVWEVVYYDKEGNLTQTVSLGLTYKCIFKIIDGFKTDKCSDIIEKPKYNGFYSIVVPPEKPIEEPEKLFPPDERFGTKYVYEYDSTGRIKIARYFQNNGRLTNKLTYTYDDKGKISEEISETRSNKFQTIYKYDDKGNKIEELTKSYSRVTEKNDYQSKIVYSDYKIDSQGNWIQRKEVYTFESSDKPIVREIINFRTIIYY